ncbi:hypothetical protein GDO81_013022 [Engystomops pustulosus]|uniref:Uncharacterized protein n=1 Tax=Engystomops pustulosus TaxID=76066 RepID=A0AAV7AXH6_ENGPU|nr:hypothetical protein GDO81_013022 [Engystomops pustulosus]KAG8565898.1 hypothetical protein GDO81_013022 [Engystomops pustulosus]
MIEYRAAYKAHFELLVAVELLMALVNNPARIGVLQSMSNSILMVLTHPIVHIRSGD